MLGTGPYFAEQGFGNLNLGDVEGIADAHDATVFRLYPDDGFDCQLDGFALRVHDDGDCTAVEIHRGDDIGVSRRNVDFLEQPHGNDVGSTHPGGIDVGFRRESEYDDFLHFRSEVPFHGTTVAAGDVGIEAGAADVLAHFVDDQHVDLVDVNLRHQALRHFLEHRFPACNLAGRHDFYDRGLVVRIFDDPHSEQDIALRQIDVAHLGQQRGKSIHAVLVVSGGAVDLADADRQHLGYAALRGAAKRRVRLDAVDDNDAVRFGREAVHVHGCAILEAADDDRVHGCLHRHA